MTEYKIPKGCSVQNNKLICPPNARVPIPQQIQRQVVRPIAEAIYVPRSPSRAKAIVGLITFIVTAIIVYLIIV